MIHFDELKEMLAAAFIAGKARGHYDLVDEAARYSVASIPPEFDQWLAATHPGLEREMRMDEFESGFGDPGDI